VSSGQASRILLITADTITKYIDEFDKGTRTIFGDGAAATLIVGNAGTFSSFGPFVYGTDGQGGPHIICANSGARRSVSGAKLVGQPTLAPRPEGDRLFMDGPRVFDFVLKEVPRCVQELLRKSNVELDGIDLFVFHQANKYILEELRRIIGIPSEKFQITLSHCGNTGSSAIPIALKHAEMDGRLTSGSMVMVVAFGVGYSWGATLLRR
jgi:3-oxoacyl-[acyl-carrier-protein] synthase III